MVIVVMMMMVIVVMVMIVTIAVMMVIVVMMMMVIVVMMMMVTIVVMMVIVVMMMMVTIVVKLNTNLATCPLESNEQLVTSPPPLHLQQKREEILVTYKPPLFHLHPKPLHLFLSNLLESSST